MKINPAAAQKIHDGEKRMTFRAIVVDDRMTVTYFIGDKTIGEDSFWASHENYADWFRSMAELYNLGTKADASKH